jgi:2-iminobutanoate/2-iminopropanoate deaminase
MTIHTDAAPKAVGPYVQAVRVGHLLFVSGQVALDPATGTMVSGGIEDQTRRVMRNLAAILEAGGSGLDRVVKATVYLTDLGSFEAMNAVYASFFPGDKPARVTVEVSRLPRNALIEIDAIGIVDGGNA